MKVPLKGKGAVVVSMHRDGDSSGGNRFSITSPDPRSPPPPPSSAQCHWTSRSKNVHLQESPSKP